MLPRAEDTCVTDRDAEGVTLSPAPGPASACPAREVTAAAPGAFLSPPDYLGGFTNTMADSHTLRETPSRIPA